jgi:hypothetical protein
MAVSAQFDERGHLAEKGGTEDAGGDNGESAGGGWGEIVEAVDYATGNEDYVAG